MEKKFKNNFGVQSDSVPLLEAFIKEAEALGWKLQEDLDELSYSKKLYFNANPKPGDGLKKGYFWVCRSLTKVTIVDLPSNWDEAIRLASAFDENPFKIGDWVTHKTEGTTYQITEIDGDGWCIGDVPGKGWSYTQLKKATKTQIAKVQTPKSFKIGDVVVITSLKGQGESAGRIFNGNIGHVGKITEVSSGGFYKLQPYCEGGDWPAYCLRYATPEEIAKLPISIKFGDTWFNITKGEDFAVTDRGNISKKEIEKVLKLFTAKMSICGYDLKIENVDKIQISFGCQTDTVGKAKEILAAFDGDVKVADLPF